MSTSNQIGSTAAQYLQALIQLAPQGKAWPTDPNSNWVKLLQVIADSCAAVDAQGCLLVDESYPDTTTQLLPNWERVAGLPDNCSVLGDTIEIRRQNLLAKLAMRGGQTVAYMLYMATLYGFTITITEYSVFQVDISTVEQALNSTDWLFAFLVTAPAVTVTYFRAGQSAAGEPLAVWGNDRLECLINKIKPAHTTPIFAF